MWYSATNDSMKAFYLFLTKGRAGRAGPRSLASLGLSREERSVIGRA